jgi:hypothetical protein
LLPALLFATFPSIVDWLLNETTEVEVVLEVDCEDRLEDFDLPTALGETLDFSGDKDPNPVLLLCPLVKLIILVGENDRPLDCAEVFEPKLKKFEEPPVGLTLLPRIRLLFNGALKLAGGIDDETKGDDREPLPRLIGAKGLLLIPPEVPKLPTPPALTPELLPENILFDDDDNDEDEANGDDRELPTIFVLSILVTPESIFTLNRFSSPFKLIWLFGSLISFLSYKAFGETLDFVLEGGGGKL